MSGSGFGCGFLLREQRKDQERRKKHGPPQKADPTKEIVRGGASGQRAGTKGWRRKASSIRAGRTVSTGRGWHRGEPQNCLLLRWRVRCVRLGGRLRRLPPRRITFGCFRGSSGDTA